MLYSAPGKAWSEGMVRINYAILPALASMAEPDRKEFIGRLIGERYYEAVYRDLTQAYREAEQVYELELPLGAYPPPKLLRYRHPADPERSPLPNLTVRG